MNWKFVKQVSHLGTKCKVMDEHFRTVAILDEDFEKSAPVISAAPELMAALEGITSYLEADLRRVRLKPDLCPEVIQARAAIRKAKGEK